MKLRKNIFGILLALISVLFWLFAATIFPNGLSVDSPENSQQIRILFRAVTAVCIAGFMLGTWMIWKRYRGTDSIK